MLYFAHLEGFSGESKQLIHLLKVKHFHHNDQWFI